MMSGQEKQPGTVAAQFHSFAYRMPPFYAGTVIKVLAIIIIFHRLAPLWLSCGVPASVATLAIWRSFWWFRHRDDEVTDEEAAAYLNRSTRVLTAATILLVATDCGLFHYGTPNARIYVLVQMVASAACGVYSLMHLRRAALLVCASLMLPFGVLACSMRSLETTLLAITTILALGIMVNALHAYEQDFFSLVRSRAEAQELSRANLRHAHSDMLTGLPNRRFFFDTLDGTAQSPAKQGALAIGLLDLDGFKPVNDTYGHRVGDTMLEIVAQRLASLSLNLQHLSRLGGDEFVFTTTLTNAEDLINLGDRVVRCVSEPVTIGNLTLCVGCSVGFAVRSSPNEPSNTALYEQADHALYQAKRTGRAKVVLFSEEHSIQLHQQGILDQTLRKADLESEFFVVYQPIVDPRTEQPMAVECLARWMSPLLGLVSPVRFILVAESTGLIGALTEVLLRKALTTAETWPENIALSFNISPTEIADREQVASIIDVVLRSRIAPGRIALELTETALLHNFVEVRSNIEMLRQLGISVYLDDFGTGHSSLSYVHSLPLDKIKVDRSFVQNIVSNTISRNIVKSVISLCRDLHIDCVIEGVETKDQLDVLTSLDADLIQGYWYSKPLPEAELHGYLNEPPLPWCGHEGTHPELTRAPVGDPRRGQPTSCCAVPTSTADRDSSV